MAARRLHSDQGQVLVIGVVFLLAVLFPLLASEGIGQLLWVRDGIQTAASSAALAGAQDVIVTEKVDATGTIYSYTVQINTSTAPGTAAAAWAADADLLLGSRTKSWHTSIDNSPPAGQGPTMNVEASVRFADWPLALIGMSNHDTVTVQATAGTCGITRWRGSFPPWCSQ